MHHHPFELGDTNSLYMACGFMFLVPVIQFGPQAFTLCLQMPHILSLMTSLIVEPVVLFTYSLAQTPQSMCTTRSISQALVEIHECSRTLQYVQGVLGVVFVIELFCKFDTKLC
ncbi:MAG: hypothetical protein ACKPKO_58130, partial [Candidatus Fonsibacter sp.]